MRQEKVTLTNDEVTNGRPAQTVVLDEDSAGPKNTVSDNQGAPEPARRKSFVIDKNANSFDGLQPERRPRKKVPRTTSSGPVPLWRHWLPVGIMVTSIVTVAFCWTQAHWSGTEYISLGKLSDAIESYKRDAAAATHDKAPSAANHIALAQIYLKENMLSDSLKYADEGLGVAADSGEKAQLHLTKGVTHAQQKRWEKSLAEFTYAIPMVKEEDLDYNKREIRQTARIGQLIANVHLQNESDVTLGLNALCPSEPSTNEIAEVGQFMFLAGHNKDAREFLTGQLLKNEEKMGAWESGKLQELLGDIALVEKNYPEALKRYSLIGGSPECRLLDKRALAHKGVGDMVAYKADMLELKKRHIEASRRKASHGGYEYDQSLYPKYFYRPDREIVKNELTTRYPELLHRDCDQ